MNAEQFAHELVPKLKECGYKKNRLTWVKTKESVHVVFSIQKSAYGSDVWYYCFGICIDPLCDTKTISMSKCQIQERRDHNHKGHLWTADDIISLLCKWENLYGDIQKLRRKAIEGKMPSQVTKEALTFLTSVDISRL